MLSHAGRDLLELVRAKMRRQVTVVDGVVEMRCSSCQDPTGVISFGAALLPLVLCDACMRRKARDTRAVIELLQREISTRAKDLPPLRGAQARDLAVDHLESAHGVLMVVLGEAIDAWTMAREPSAGVAEPAPNGELKDVVFDLMADVETLLERLKGMVSDKPMMPPWKEP